jgi:hypothetical protein
MNLSRILNAFRWRSFLREGLWRDPDPCSKCGSRTFYVVQKDEGLHAVCALCKGDST